MEGVLGHIAAVILGFVMMVVGLGLGVTMIMLPVGTATLLNYTSPVFAVLFASLFIGERVQPFIAEYVSALEI